MYLRRLLAIGALPAIVATLSAASPAMAKSEDKDTSIESVTTFIEMEALTVNIFRSNYNRGKVEIIINLDIPDQNVRTRAAETMPRLRAAYVQVLTSLLYDLPPRTPPNIEELDAALQRTTDKVLGRRGAKVLLGSVVIN